MKKIMADLIKRTCLIFLVVLFVSMVSCGSEKIEYSFEELTEEISDDQYNRNVNILKIESNSKHEEEINRSICDFFNEKLESYKNGVPVDWQHLYIDTTYTEKDGCLCITAIANTPNATYIAPLFAKSVYLDLSEDKLYSFEEYADRIHVDLDKVKEEASEKLDNEVGNTEFTLDGLFYSNNDVIFILQLDITNETGADAASTAFYNYTQKKIIHGSSSDFECFDKIIASN